MPGVSWLQTITLLLHLLIWRWQCARIEQSQILDPCELLHFLKNFSWIVQKPSDLFTFVLEMLTNRCEFWLRLTSLSVDNPLTSKWRLPVSIGVTVSLRLRFWRFAWLGFTWPRGISRHLEAPGSQNGSGLPGVAPVRSIPVRFTETGLGDGKRRCSANSGSSNKKQRESKRNKSK